MELQANGSSAEMNLGKGNYRYFSLVLANVEYTSISNSQTFLLLLIIPKDTTII